MAHVATESLQPHLQASRMPTRRTSGLGFSEAVWAMAKLAKASRSAATQARQFRGREKILATDEHR
jgi:hypothetical protein